MAARLFPEIPEVKGISRLTWLLNWMPLLTFIMFQLLMLVVLLYQVRANLSFRDGDESFYNWVFISGAIGIVLSILPVGVYFCDLDGVGKIWFDFIAPYPDRSTMLSAFLTILFHASFCIAFIVLMALMGNRPASLTRVQQVLYIEPSCENARLLLVDELLTFKLPVSGFATTAERSLPNYVEPFNITLKYITVPGLRMAETHRADAEKWQLNYESGHITTVRLEFQRVFEPFQVHLNYRARLQGSNESCQNGGSVCFAGRAGWSRIDGWWDVFAPGDHVDTSLDLGGCTGTGACGWGPGNLTSSASRTEDGAARWRVQLEVPETLGVGTDRCPLAWEISSRNIFWYIGAVLLAAAGFCCVLDLKGAEGGGSGADSCVMLTCAISCLIALSALVMFGMALFADSRTSDR